MNTPEIVWTEPTRYGTIHGRIGTLTSPIFAISYDRESTWTVRCELPGYTGRDIRSGTVEELQVFAQKLVHVWFSRAYGERFGDAVKSA